MSVGRVQAALLAAQGVCLFVRDLHLLRWKCGSYVLVGWGTGCPAGSTLLGHLAVTRQRKVQSLPHRSVQHVRSSTPSFICLIMPSW